MLSDCAGRLLALPPLLGAHQESHEPGMECRADIGNDLSACGRRVGGSINESVWFVTRFLPSKVALTCTGRRRPVLVLGSCVVAVALLVLGWTREIVWLFLSPGNAVRFCERYDLGS